eukprot:s782_g1.t1
MCWEHGGERWMWRCILAALQAEGPIAIKFAQWASTRPDILPRSVCDHLSPLQASVRPHSFRQTKRILTETFGPAWENSLQLEAEPLGSGCMAQVHRGCLHGPLQGQLPTKQDLCFIQVRRRGRELLTSLPALQQFSICGKDKVDLDLEALHSSRGLGALEARAKIGATTAKKESILQQIQAIAPNSDLKNNFPLPRCCHAIADEAMGNCQCKDKDLPQQREAFEPEPETVADDDVDFPEGLSPTSKSKAAPEEPSIGSGDEKAEGSQASGASFSDAGDLAALVDAEDTSVCNSSAGSEISPKSEDTISRRKNRMKQKKLKMTDTMGFVPSAALLVVPDNRGKLADNYEVEAVALGKGGFAEVRKATVRVTGAKRAVKIISKSDKNNPGLLKAEILVCNICKNERH